MRQRVIKLGSKFGAWVAIKPVVGSHHPKWICFCSCKSVQEVWAYDLVIGKSTRCRKCARTGSNNGRYLHGSRYTRLYFVWLGIKQRCCNPNHKSYKYYGGRGIGMCNEWERSFTAFESAVKKLGPWPGKGWSIDRKDNAKGYQPRNIRWATQEQQMRNSRRWKKG